MKTKKKDPCSAVGEVMWRASSVAAVAIWKHISAASAQRALSAAGAWNPGSGRDWQAPGLGLLPMPGSDHGQSPKNPES